MVKQSLESTRQAHGLVRPVFVESDFDAGLWPVGEPARYCRKYFDLLLDRQLVQAQHIHS